MKIKLNTKETKFQSSEFNNVLRLSMNFKKELKDLGFDSELTFTFKDDK